jgi:hypothetical protein
LFVIGPSQTPFEELNDEHTLERERSELASGLHSIADPLRHPNAADRHFNLVTLSHRLHRWQDLLRV